MQPAQEKDTIRPVQAAPRTAGEWSQFKGDTEGRKEASPALYSGMRGRVGGGGRKKVEGGGWGGGRSSRLLFSRFRVLLKKKKEKKEKKVIHFDLDLFPHAVPSVWNSFPRELRYSYSVHHCMSNRSEAHLRLTAASAQQTDRLRTEIKILCSHHYPPPSTRCLLPV